MDRLTAVQHIMSSVHAQPVGVLPYRITLALTAGSWNDTTKVLTQAGVFTTMVVSYTEGFIYLTGGTGITVDWYPFTTGVANSVTIPTLSLGASPTNITGSMARAYATDPASAAERFLDLATIEVQDRGFEANTDICRTITVANSSIDQRISAFGYNVLRVRGAGKDQHRKFTMRYGQVYDLNQNTSTLTNGDTVQLDIVRRLPFEACPEELQILIMNEAKLKFQRRWGGDPEHDVQLQQERAMPEIAITRNAPKGDGMPMNAQPIVPQAAPIR